MAPSLTRLYNSYNRRYFANRLPQNMTLVGFWGKQLPINKVGVYLGVGSKISLKIGRKVVERLQGPIIMVRVGGRYDFDIRLTLLHEMAHASSSHKHGTQFQKEMLRLAKAGAFKGLW